MENIQHIPFPIFTTSRLILRSLKIEDANEILLLRSNKKVNEFIDRPETTNIEDAKKFIEKIQKGIKNKESFYWAITLKDSDTLIGTICCFNISVEKTMAEIGYELHPDFHGKGIMQEAISKVISWGFEELRLNTITALSKCWQYQIYSGFIEKQL